MIITRYIIREITTPFLIGSTLLLVIYAGYTTSAFLADAASNVLQPGIIAYLIFLNTIPGLGVILPTALYFSVVFGLGRLYRDSEMVSMMAAGISELRVLVTVFYLALVVALITGFVSTVARPWAFHMSYLLEARAMAELDIEKLQAGRFIDLKHSNYILYAGEIDRVNKRLRDVYLRTDHDEGVTRVILAETLYLPVTEKSVARPVEFENGYAYLLDRRGHKDSILHFGMLRLHLEGGVLPVGHKRKAEKTFDLAESGKPAEIAEFQWRLAIPLTTIILALLGVPLSRMLPQQGRYSRIILAIVVYALLFNLSGVARTWVEQDRVAAIPGIWWVHVLSAILLIILIVRPLWTIRSPGR